MLQRLLSDHLQTSPPHSKWPKSFNQLHTTLLTAAPRVNWMQSLIDISFIQFHLVLGKLLLVTHHWVAASIWYYQVNQLKRPGGGKEGLILVNLYANKLGREKNNKQNKNNFNSKYHHHHHRRSNNKNGCTEVGTSTKEVGKSFCLKSSSFTWGGGGWWMSEWEKGERWEREGNEKVEKDKNE